MRRPVRFLAFLAAIVRLLALAAAQVACSVTLCTDTDFPGSFGNELHGIFFRDFTLFSLLYHVICLAQVFVQDFYVVLVIWTWLSRAHARLESDLVHPPARK